MMGTKLMVTVLGILVWALGLVMGATFPDLLTALPETPQVDTTEYTATYARLQEWEREMVELAPRLEKMQYHLQAIHKRVLLPTLDIDMTK